MGPAATSWLDDTVADTRFASSQKCCTCSSRDSSRQERAAAGLTGLPEMYHQVKMRALHSSRFEGFDFERHNPTRFAGLENEIANCYANALLQV